MKNQAPYPSLLTVLFAVFLIVSAFFMRQVLELYISFLGRSGVIWSIWAAFFVMAVVIFWLFKKQVLKFNCKGTLVFVAGLVYAASFDIAEERVHLIKYGTLGFLFSRDMSPWYSRNTPLIAVMFTLAVAAIDEIFQHFLPYRVGDIRDVMFGGIGGLWGSLIYCFFKTNSRNSIC